MKKVKIHFLFSLVLVMILSLFPYKISFAQDQFTFNGMKLYKTYYPGNVVHDGNTIPRSTTDLWFSFNTLIDESTVQKLVTVKDSSGNTVDWHDAFPTGVPDNERGFDMRFNTILIRNETYTVTIKGGSDGVKDQQGNTLPSDITLTFKTDNETFTWIQQFKVYFDSFTQTDFNVFHFTAEKGDASIGINTSIGSYEYDKVNNGLHVLIKDMNTNQTIIDNDFDYAGGKKFKLPEAGEYEIVTSPIYKGSYPNQADATITLSASELKADDVNVPNLTIGDLKNYETRNNLFSIPITAKNGLPPKEIHVYLDNKLTQSLQPNSDGTFNSFSIDPSSLSEGVHSLFIVGIQPESENYSQLDRFFIVDRHPAFGDVSQIYWGYKQIQAMHYLGILNGRGNNLFEPEAPVTREEFASMIARTLNLTSTGSTNVNFVDVQSDSWSKPAIDALAQAGFINGDVIDGQRYFHPGETITRADACTIIGNTLGISHSDISGQKDPFPDFNVVPSWSKSSVLLLTHGKWINGFEDGLFHPLNSLSRAEAAKILSNYIGL